MQVPSRLDTEELLKRAATGDSSAVTSLFDRYRLRLRRMVQSRMDGRLISRLDPSDIVQEAFLEAHRLLPCYLRMRPVAFYPWLKQITANRLIDMYRRHVMAQHRTVQRETGFPREEDPSTQLLADQFISSDNAAARLIRDELRDRVRKAVEKLPAEFRDVLVLRHVELKSVAEIASLLNVAEGTVRSRQFRALAQLRHLLESG